MQAGKTHPELRTDWERVKREAAQDAPVAFDPATDPYDPNDAQAAYWRTATVRRGRPPVVAPRPTLTMRIDADVLAAFKATGPGWQTRINAVLREAVNRGADSRLDVFAQRPHALMWLPTGRGKCSKARKPALSSFQGCWRRVWRWRRRARFRLLWLAAQ